MRIRSGHKPEDWIDCPPANPGSMPIRGALVVGGSGPRDRSKHNAYQARYVAKMADCSLTGYCRHPECVDTRRLEAKRLLASDPNMTLRQVGVILGGRSHSTIGDLLKERAA